MKSRLFLMFLACLRVSESYAISENVLKVLSLFNGHWHNKPQIDQGDQDHDYVQGWSIPVDVPALYPNAALVVNESSNGILRVFNLAEVYDGVEKDTVVLKLYNVTGITKDKDGTYDMEKLKAIKREDLQSTEDCYAVFDVSNENFVTGSYPYCSYTINGKHPRFSLTFGCETAVAILPLDTVQRSPIEPYLNRRIGSRYPLIKPPKDYVGPCDK